MPIVKLYANLRRVAGVKEISVPAASLETLLPALVAELPALESHLFEDGSSAGMLS
jgi:molybdopterin converting factor small subunit